MGYCILQLLDLLFDGRYIITYFATFPLEFHVLHIPQQSLAQLQLPLAVTGTGIRAAADCKQHLVVCRNKPRGEGGVQMISLIVRQRVMAGSLINSGP